jgi:hypothetical protein
LAKQVATRRDFALRTCSITWAASVAIGAMTLFMTKGWERFGGHRHLRDRRRLFRRCRCC